MTYLEKRSAQMMYVEVAEFIMVLCIFVKVVILR